MDGDDSSFVSCNESPRSLELRTDEPENKKIVLQLTDVIQSLQRQISELEEKSSSYSEDSQKEEGDILTMQHDIIKGRLDKYRQQYKLANGREPDKMEMMAGPMRQQYLKFKAIVNVMKNKEDLQKRQSSASETGEQLRAEISRLTEENCKLQEQNCALRAERRSTRQVQHANSQLASKLSELQIRSQTDQVTDVLPADCVTDIPFVSPIKWGLSSKSAIDLNIYCRNSLVGFKTYHTGVVVHGREYSFAHTHGVFWTLPTKSAKSFLSTSQLGDVSLTPLQVEAVISSLLCTWSPDSYHIIKRNCNSFSRTFIATLFERDGRRTPEFPAYINRLADTVPAALAAFM